MIASRLDARPGIYCTYSSPGFAIVTAYDKKGLGIQQQQEEVNVVH